MDADSPVLADSAADELLRARVLERLKFRNMQTVADEFGLDIATLEEWVRQDKLRAEALRRLRFRTMQSVATDLGVPMEVLRAWVKHDKKRLARKRYRKNKKQRLAVASLPVVITVHARRRARTRFRLNEISEAKLEKQIVRDVREAISRQRMSDRKPRWCWLYGDKGELIAPAGNAYLWDEAEQRAYAVAFEAERIVVITSLCRTMANEMLVA